MSYLAEQGYKVAPFKVGPDFIDPGHHAAVSGRVSYNLDSWMLPVSYNQNLFSEKSKDADIAVVEGVMGLFDGFSGTDEAGSTAQMAKLLGLPVLLVVNASGMARSAAAIVKGFETFDPDLKIAGVVFSKTGSRHHYQYLKEAVEQSCNAKCIGYMPKNDEIVMPERHLGLVTAEENQLSGKTMSILSSMVEDYMDMPGFINSLGHLKIEKSSTGAREYFADKRPVIAVARDKAFCFYYKDNLEILEQAGAELIEFSPLDDKSLPAGIDGLYFGGGYPEVFAEQLSGNTRILKQVNDCSKAGMPVYGECGGFMYLCKALHTAKESREYPMTGCFEFSVKMSTKLRSLGYREISVNHDTLIGQKGHVVRGHEFHYSSVDSQTKDRTGSHQAVSDIYQVSSRAGQEVSLKGYQVLNTLGSYLHIHFGSNPDSAAAFVRACRAFKNKIVGEKN